MKHLTLFYFFLLFIITLTVYYLIGGDKFPDYNNYLSIANGSVQWSKGTYLTEFLTQAILIQPIMIENINNVDILAFFVQMFIFILSMYYVRNNVNYLYPMVVFLSLYLPIFLTTTLRAAPLYFLFFIMSLKIFKSEVRYTHVFIFFILGSLFHDSVFIITGALIFSKLFVFIFNSSVKSYRYLFLISLLVLLVGSPLKEFIIQNINLDFLGERAVYLRGYEYSFMKMAYVLIINFLCLLFIVDTKVFNSSKLIALALTLSLNVVFVLSSTAGIRYSIFILAYLIAGRGVLLHQDELFKRNPIIVLPFLLLIFFIQFRVLI
ncbi:hypothetical protein [Moritella sp. Urea-trap-13]|uniref:hypothetical protein n=1 Tax=Moritella sp. Urea-trap-13 TaxID=2058327 RepID=UPI000C34E41D|nr:hypothetical protein [Moritella sp. Urea-trap-13]PKH05307.1 hypothetical protein CXF93_18650 [Moritella sp. Urea-trap-13]